MNEKNGEILAKRISKVLTYLKTKKITQYEVEQKLNYTSLSKAKNFGRYPQPVIEKRTRLELLNELLDTYSLVFDEKLDEVTDLGVETPIKTDPEVIHYIMYYYAFARKMIDKAIVRIVGKRKVFIDYRMEEHWEGNYEVIENYVFISAVKLGDTTPVKKMISLFTGTMKYGRPILLGTYSTVKRDGYPAAGKVVFVKYEEQNIDRGLKEMVDPRISYYIGGGVITTETFTPDHIDNLSKDYKLIESYSGLYVFLYSKNEEILKEELILNPDGTAVLSLYNVRYDGEFRLLDSHTIEIRMDDNEQSYSHSPTESITIMINTKNVKYTPFYLARCVSNAVESTPNIFSSFIIKKDQFSSDSNIPEIANGEQFISF